MHDGLPTWELQFRFSSNRLCLSFCATVGERWRRCFERLRGVDDLGRWLVAARLLSEAPEATQRQLDQARALREAIYRSVRSAMTNHELGAADVAIINRFARGQPLCPQLGADGARETWSGPDPVASGLATIAADAVELLTSADLLRRVRECDAADCALLFLDTSRPGRRRWCADGACGSRARSAAYRSRLHSSR